MTTATNIYLETLLVKADALDISRLDKPGSNLYLSLEI